MPVSAGPYNAALACDREVVGRIFLDQLKESRIVQGKRVRRNAEILSPRVRVIGPNGDQLGIMTVQEALRSAESSGLDLVEVAPGAEPPVCRIMDYGKFVFEQNKKAQSARRKQKQIQVKEVKFRPGTERATIRSSCVISSSS